MSAYQNINERVTEMAIYGLKLEIDRLENRIDELTPADHLDLSTLVRRLNAILTRRAT